jgi:signal transduction histidine kinase/ligand-binding sensor domain-containing protein/CheY-like chemotaxis protein/HPt (histidine-containing phosphotransfer) domain-containing protein
VHRLAVSTHPLWRAWRAFLIGWLLGVSAAGGAAAAEAPALILQHLTTADGLPQGTVYTTLQDSQGFIWLATEDGLVRYDGRELKRYAYSPSSSSGLPGNFIYDVVEDADHNLWVAIKDTGLARWDRATDSFTIFRHDPKNADSLASDSIRSLLVDAQGRLWVGTSDAGVDIRDPHTRRFTHLRHDAHVANSLLDDRVQRVEADRTGTVWVSTLSGLDRWLPQQRGFAHLQHLAGDATTLSGTRISHVLQDRSGGWWVTSIDGGADLLDRNGHVQAAYRHDPKNPGSLLGDEVQAILQDQSGDLWVGTSQGLDLLDRSSNQFHHYTHDPKDAGTLPDSDILSLYEDPSGLVWIGTRAGGVSRWNPRSWELGGQRPAWLHENLAMAFADAPDNRIWIASMGAGLKQLDPATGQVLDFDALSGLTNALGDKRVMSLRTDRNGALWIGTMSSGLHRFAGGKLTAIPVKVGDAHSLSTAGIMSIFEARDGMIWLGTFGGGANVLDPATGLVRQLPFGDSQPGAISGANVSAIAQDTQGNMWIATDGHGLDLARPDGRVIKVFRHEPHDPTSLPADAVYVVTVDARGNIWVGTDSGGLAQVEGSSTLPDTIHFRTFAQEETLSTHTIWGVVDDLKGRLWLSGDAGLVRFDPDTGAVKTYHREDGLQGEEFNFGAFARLSNGRLAFGGPGGFNIFDPQRLTESRPPLHLALTRVEILGVPATTPSPYWLLQRLDLDHRASILSLDFGVLDFTSPKRNHIAYRMAGLTDKWIDLGTQNRITLTNLDAGDHLLEVRAANSDSLWSETPLQLRIHKDPAPWRSRGAYAVYLLLILGLVAYRLHLHRAKFRRVLQERQHLETEVALRTRELLETNRQLEEASRAKTQFMDRMSHELRTPMNGVVGMTELLARTPLSAKQARLTHTIRSSAQTLLQIVNDLLDLSKIRAGKLQTEDLPINLLQILEECTGLFAGAAESKRIELIVCPPAQAHPALLGDPLRIRQILMNLVGNAVKFTTQGEVVVKADLNAGDAGMATLELSVTDTGIGMDAATIAKIFEPFTQADESTTRRFGGSGLGLAICRDLAQIMGGSIRVESQLQLGSSFVLTLPLRVAAAPEAVAPQLPPRSVRILTRHLAMAESLSRHLTALGLTPLGQDWNAATAIADLIIVDASNQQEYLRVRAAAATQAPPLVLVASSPEIESHRFDGLVASDCIVLKPVHRETLGEAVAAVLGLAPAPATAASQLAAPEAIGGHVLLVEDEPVNAAVAQGYLEALGCTWVWVKDGPEAVARSAVERFELILMDLSMPTMDGYATTALIRQRDAHKERVPIVALSAHDAGTYRAACLEAGMDDMLSKPYTLEACAQLLRRWLRRDGLSAILQSTPPPLPSLPSPPLPPELSTVDTKTVASLRHLRSGGGADLYPKLVALFQTGSAESLAALELALAGPDLGAASALCHKFKSSAANVGALAFSRELALLEKACDTGNLELAQQLYARVRGAYPALLDELGNLTLRASA